MNDTTPKKSPAPASAPSRIERLKTKALNIYDYCVDGVWTDTRRNWKVTIVKTVNLTVRSFMNPDFQNLSAAMTYRTVLAVVPMLALLFAVCRGFGFESLLTSELTTLVPSQEKAMSTAMRFVDSYLEQASEGVFVGVGIVFLLWTVISLLGSVEESFNIIWNVKQGRTLWRKVTDYLGIFIVLPTLIICSSGIMIILDTTLKKLLPFEGLTPAISFGFECLSVVLTWLFFAGAYMLIPCTKVKFKNAFFAGALAGTAYLVLQWLFVSGQVYVSKYNAIYGSFSFLPLLLIWLQLVWMFTFTGATVCYASQNFDRFNFQKQVDGISLDYYHKCVVAVTAIVAKRFQRGLPDLNSLKISQRYHLPLTLTERIVNRLIADGILVNVAGTGSPDGVKITGVQPAVDLASLTLGFLLDKIYHKGYRGFIPDFQVHFPGVVVRLDQLETSLIGSASDILLTDLDLEGFEDPASDNS
ncbi:MAG: YihY/virulence factor BrkB family protein [Clostridium sp.]|nr:YihY/virulence factor BrkB family protein [Clostridium sp.]